MSKIKPMLFSADARITKAFNEAKVLPLNNASKYILFSDCHRGDNSFADDFSHNRKIFHFALSKYFQEEYTYIELGDCDELWENDFNSIFRANKDVFLLLKKFNDAKRLHFIWGNHDMDYKNPENVTKNLSHYFDTIDEKNKKLLVHPSFSEGIRLEQQDGNSIFLLHGHQADWFNYNCWKLSRFLVKILWKPLQILGIKDPTSPAQNFKELIKVERHLERWIRKNNNQIIVTGHTHRPRFPLPNELPYFNDGSCVHPRCITGIEIQNNQIALIKWHTVTHEDGTLQIIKSVLEAPQEIVKYMS